VVVIHDGNLLENKYYKYYLNTKLYKIEDKQSYINFWKPLEAKLDKVRNIYFSSDGIYNLINLWILKNPINGKYLIDEQRIINLTNTRQLVSDQKQVIEISSVLLLGRPNYTLGDTLNNTSQDVEVNRAVSRFFRAGVSDLPGTEDEVKMIEDFLKQNKIESKVLLWDNASEELLKEEQSKHIIHIATHGFFDTDIQGRNPMLRSGLLLAGVSKAGNKSKEDGILTAYEASNLDLNNTALVVLSACETGLGEVKSGEGVYGLQRAFEVAGVDAILMSMWKVNDQTTQELMVLFYKELIKNKSVPESFRNAQLQIREKYKEPLYWGAFKLIGY
jgi:CHAT domain-containing protein